MWWETRKILETIILHVWESNEKNNLSIWPHVVITQVVEALLSGYTSP